jgi:predicted RNA-binding protein associated with RNAse of E/G family
MCRLLTAIHDTQYKVAFAQDADSPFAAAHPLFSLLARKLNFISSGAWQNVPDMTDYRTEWLTGMLVERATWSPSAPVQRIGSTIVGAPGYVWFRFWLQEQEQVVEKYFDTDKQTVGFYAPICASWRRRDTRIVAPSLMLGLWLEGQGRVTVMYEDAFDQAAHNGDLTPIEVEHAEQRIRELTLAIHRQKWPPAMVKTLELSATAPRATQQAQDPAGRTKGLAAE